MRIYRRGESWFMDLSSGGKRVRRRIPGARSKSEAQAALSAVQTDILRGAYKFKENGERRLFREMVDEYLVEKAQKRSLKEDEKLFKTIIPVLGDRRLDQITVAEIEEYKANRLQAGLAGATVNRGLALLKHLFNIAIRKGYLDKNPVKDVKFCREASWRHKYILSGPEIQKLLEAAAPHLRPILIIAFGTGLRKGDILNLRWENIDFDSHLIHLMMQKTEEPIEIPMLPIVEETLRKLKAEREATMGAGDTLFPFVFMSTRRGRRSNEYSQFVDIKTSFHAALRRADLDGRGYRFHDIRRTFASMLSNAGVPLIIIQRLLGHKSITTTERYLNIRLEETRQAVMILDSIWGQKSSFLGFGGTNMAQVVKADTATGLLSAGNGRPLVDS